MKGKRETEPSEPWLAEISHRKKRAFLIAFSGLGTITHAANAAKIVRQTHRNWLADPETGKTYREAFEVAQEKATESLEVEARRRAFDGSDLLLIFLMKGAQPQKYRDRYVAEHTGPGGTPLQATQNNFNTFNVNFGEKLLDLEDDEFAVVETMAARIVEPIIQALPVVAPQNGNGNGHHA